MQFETREGLHQRRHEHRFWKRALMRLRDGQVIILIILAVSILSAAGFVLVRTAPKTKTDLRSTLALVARHAVEVSVNPKVQTSFPGDDEIHIAKLPNDKYLVSGWVDLMTNAGQIARHSFNCTVYLAPDGEWTAESIAVVAQ